MDVNQESLKLHEELRGKIEVVARRHIETRDDLSLLYTPRRGRALPGDRQGL